MTTVIFLLVIAYGSAYYEWREFKKEWQKPPVSKRLALNAFVLAVRCMERTDTPAREKAEFRAIAQEILNALECKESSRKD